METLHALMQKNTLEKVKKSDISGFFQQTVLGSKTQQQVEIYPRSELSEPISEIREIKMETPESIRTFLQTDKWVTSID